MSREPSHLEDAVWGSLRVTRDPEDGYYLETEITVGPKGREITLSFTCPERSLSGEQQNLAESIVNSIEEALISAATLYSLTYGSDLLAEYGVEMVSLPEQGDTWEL